MTSPVCLLLEENVFDDANPQLLAEAAREMGLRCARASFAGSTADPDGLRPTKPVPFGDDDLVFAYGSMNLMQSLRRQNRWPRLGWYDFDRLRCQSYYAHWGQFLLQEQYVFLPLAEVRRRQEWLYATLGQDGVIFVRPDDNAKSFAGGLVHVEKLEDWWRLANFYEPGPECLAVVAAPRQIETEWRFVIANRRVVAGSRYKQGRQEAIAGDYPPEAADFAESVATSGGFNPHPVYVMDVCCTADGRHRMVEIGSVCCASLYACNIANVVQAVVMAAEEAKPGVAVSD